jgi:hypothetical protein
MKTIVAVIGAGFHLLTWMVKFRPDGEKRPTGRNLLCLFEIGAGNGSAR